MYYNAVISGMCAALASLLGKLSGIFEWGSLDSAVLKIILLLAMFLSNACVWTFFVKALHSSKSSLSATVTSSATNYFCSALAGYLFFNEVTSLLWWAGTSLIIIGILVINRSQGEELKNKSS
ncbi:hypothetical protein R5R35_011389 [Gryllus longicercus]|uniref:EamA domain-containing protein n=1 Tax=Gryllus longicercus TaxID=2509291 RepID=A0AAN9Z9G3_9ORTH